MKEELNNLVDNKKGQSSIFGQLGALATGVATLAIILVITFLIIAQGKAQIVSVQGINESDPDTWTGAYNGTNELQNAVDDIPGWIPLIIIASIGSILLGLVALFRNR